MTSLNLPPLQKLRSPDGSVSESHGRLNDILRRDEYRQYVSNLRGEDLTWLVDHLDKALVGLDPSSSTSRSWLHELRSICGTKAILPKPYNLSSNLLHIDSGAVASGDCDVFEGTYDGSKVCIKRVRMYARDSPQTTAQTFYQEAVLWKHLKHPNILPFLGVTADPLQLVSDWMPGGALPEYIKDNPGADRLRLLSDVASGLKYLHSRGVIHGDLKGSNVVVDADGCARIMDFRPAMVILDVDSEQAISDQHARSRQWSAPEVLGGGAISKETDIFSLAMVMIEVFTGTTPFGDSQSLMAMLSIMQGGRPPRPTHPDVTGMLWNLIKRCWNEDPHSRPEVSEVLQVLLKSNPPAWKKLISPTIPTEERIALIKSIFSDRDEVEVFEYLSGDDAQAFIDVIDEALGNSNSLPPETRRRCLHCLLTICGRRSLLPKRLPVPLCYNPVEPPLYDGEVVSVWKGRCGGQEVAAKVFKVPKSDMEQTRERFCEQVVIWKSLRHPNVLQLLGVVMTENRFAMVSEWMTNGNINQFVKDHPDANRLELLADIAKGLIYMHDQGIVHGNIDGSNVLIDNDGLARLAGFNLLTIIPDEQLIASSDRPSSITKWADSVRWSAPEVLEGGVLSNKADIFSLAMVMIEVFTGVAPFSDYPPSMTISPIIQGRRPPRPTNPDVTGRLWKLMQQCWDQNPQSRPEAPEVLQILLDSDPPLWKRLISPSLSTNERLQLIGSIFSERDEVEVFEYLSGDDAQAFVDVIDEVLGGLDGLSPEVRTRCLRSSYRTCGREGLLPKSLPIQSCCDPMEALHCSGTIVDVWKGEHDGRPVAAKALRESSMSDFEAIKKRFCKEAMTWKTLRHQNVVPLLGTMMTEDPPRLVMVSEWMENANINAFVKANPDVNRLELLADVTEGLIYMHDQGIVHGNLSGSNILIDDNGSACLAGFSLLTTIPDELTIASSASSGSVTRWAGGVQWSAPEVLNNGATSKETDVFSLAMVMIEVFTGITPFGDFKPIEAMLAITQGRRPLRPKHPDVAGALWSLIQRCWHEDPRSRPEASEVLQVLFDSNPPTWKRFINPTVSTEERIDMIASIFSDRNEAQAFEYLSGCDAQAFVDIIYEALEVSGDLSTEIRRSCLRSSYRICHSEALLPKSLQIPLCFDPAENPQCKGGLADVWKTKHKGRCVAAKALRVALTSNLEETRKWFCKEVVIWKTLSHSNVLPLIGVTMLEKPHRFVMVSEWMENGNINQFLQRVNADRLKLLKQVAQGLIYLHGEGVVHGDLKGPNILINNDGHAVLADFSLITLISDPSTFVSTCLMGGTFQWMSPELLDPSKFGSEKPRPTKESDCYAFGMVIYEILSGCKPFGPNSSIADLARVLDGKRPERPQGEAGKLLTDRIWNVVQLCWKAQPVERASAEDVLQVFERDGDTDGLQVVQGDGGSVIDLHVGPLGGHSKLPPDSLMTLD